MLLQLDLMGSGELASKKWFAHSVSFSLGLFSKTLEFSKNDLGALCTSLIKYLKKEAEFHDRRDRQTRLKNETVAL